MKEVAANKVEAMRGALLPPLLFRNMPKTLGPITPPREKVAFITAEIRSDLKKTATRRVKSVRRNINNSIDRFVPV